MSLLVWTVIFLVMSLFWKWVLSWGGAQWLEGWKSFFVFDWFVARWNAEQIRLYALLCWILTGAWFVAGVLVPGLRFVV